MESNETLIVICRRLIETSLNWGDPSSWTNEDFEQLSERIFEKTTVRLSVSTLKRIWGKVRYENSPTTATLNALARFAGFAGWREFQQRQAGASVSIPPGGRDRPSSLASIPATASVPVTGPRRRLFMTTVIVSTAVLTGLLSLFGSRFHTGQRAASSRYAAGAIDPADAAGVQFSGRKVSGDLPNSVVFTYDASSLHPDKVIIQQSWDTTRRETVPVDGSAHTSLYYYPGYFMAKLIVDGVIRRESPVFIQTKGWKGMIGTKPLPVYLTTGETRVADAAQGPATMGISSQTLRQKTGSALFNGTWVEFFNVRPFDSIAADHFTFSTTLRNTSTVEECLCREIKITVLGTESAIIIPLADKGCISDLNLLTGERWISGKDNDLSAFGCDFRNFQQLTVGRIVGVRIAFEGAGEIRDVSLQGTGRPVNLL